MKANIKAEELRKKDRKELENLIIDLKRKLREVKFDSAARKVKNAGGTKYIKRDVARIITVLKEKKHTTNT